MYSFFGRVKERVDYGGWILEALVEKVRTGSGKSVTPSYGIIDSQSTKTVADSTERGIDGGKKQRVEKDIL